MRGHPHLHPLTAATKCIYTLIYTSEAVTTSEAEKGLEVFCDMGSVITGSGGGVPRTPQECHVT